ncbi:uracil-DNA glycosylase [Bacillaceae bacterium W0354]
MEIRTDWKWLLQSEFTKDYFSNLINIIEEEYKNKTIFPARKEVFRALNETSFCNTKVVIIGQDPYHGENQANGLSFSVNKGATIPPSLNNIYKELVNDLNCPKPRDGDLTHWAQEGVLLLNTVLTVEKGKAHSHRNIGWETFTDKIISIINEKKQNIVFILWGKQALNKGKVIDITKHYIIYSPHPSPLSAQRGFFNSRPFSKTNDYLRHHEIKPIKWTMA